MRQFSEPSVRNLLRKPLVLGIPLPSLLFLGLITLTLELTVGNSPSGSAITAGTAIGGYILLRILTRFLTEGWEEEIVFRIERLISRPKNPSLKIERSRICITSPDTLTQGDLIYKKEELSERIEDLKTDRSFTLLFQSNPKGLSAYEVLADGIFDFKSSPLNRPELYVLKDKPFVYSLVNLPVFTDPLWLFSVLKGIDSDFCIAVRIKGVNQMKIREKIENSRKRSAQGTGHLEDIDAKVTFTETTQILEEISRGNESIVEISLTIASKTELNLNSRYFHLEKSLSCELSIISTLGIRKRFFRSLYVRAVTAGDLIPNIGDPTETDCRPILKTVRKKPLYFSAQDKRLENLHWLVVGASGTGKSLFTALVLSRMIRNQDSLSVLFVDHGRSFRRSVRKHGGKYLEPQNFSEIKSSLPSLLKNLNEVGSVAGVELSDLPLKEKKEAAQYLLQEFEEFLRNRPTFYPVYLVLDECYNFLRENPLLVQRAFREYRKLNGAAIAITQSLSDFLLDESGHAILQSATIRILLRQGEDVSPYLGALQLNSVEHKRVSFLKQEKGIFSECLIKTPFFSALGRLYPTPEEHELFRTDNLKEELYLEQQKKRNSEERCASTL